MELLELWVLFEEGSFFEGDTGRMEAMQKIGQDGLAQGSVNV